MEQSSARWHEVSKSEFAHEQQGLADLALSVPDAPPFHVWTNFEFQDHQGQWHEIDALVLGRGGLHLVELKSWSGLISGNEHKWRSIRSGGRTVNHPNPTKTANRKAKRLASKLGDEFRQIQQLADFPIPQSFMQVPWVQECVFLHSPQVVSNLDPSGEQNIFGLDGREAATNLPGISERLTEPARRQQVTEDFARIMVVSAMNEIAGFAPKRVMAGKWELTEQLDNEDDRQVWIGENPQADEQVIVRVTDTPPDTPAGEREAIERRARREYDLLKSLSHRGIVAPFDFEHVDRTDAPALLFRPNPGFEPLDLLLPGLSLTAEQQIEIITQIADAVTYAHANNIVHRRLAPASVLLNTDKLNGPHPEIDVQVSHWSALSEADTQTRHEGTQLSRGTGTSTTNGAQYDDFAAYLPPEGFTGDGDRRVGDLFSIGALAFFILSGGKAPALDRAGLIKRLKQDRGLDLATTGAEVEEELRRLISGTTAAEPATRIKAIQQAAGSVASGQSGTANPVQTFLAALETVTKGRRIDDGDDPLQPTIDALVGGRFVIRKQMGTGSTARGFLVEDTADTGADGHGTTKVLKVALDSEKALILRDEAETLTKLSSALDTSKYAKHFVTLIEGPLDLEHQRTALLLSNGGEYTLADSVEIGNISARDFWSYGRQLLTIVAELEATGITHRDIKPANIGLFGKPSSKRLVLFDFSLSHESLSRIELGTSPYRDPFLGEASSRWNFDSYAERYSAAVVLHQMATGSRPSYAEDGTAVELTDGQLLLDTSDLPDVWSEEQRSLIRTFLTDALNADVDRRPRSAKDMLDSFVAASKAGDKADQKKQLRARPQPTTPLLSDTGLPSLEALTAELISSSGAKGTVSRRLVANILGRAPKNLDDPFVRLSEYAEHMNSSTAKVQAASIQLDELWAMDSLKSSYTQLQEKLRKKIQSLGGIGTIDDVIEPVEELFPASTSPLPGSFSPDSLDRTRRGVLRLAELGIRADESAADLSVIRRGDAHTIVGLSDDPSFNALPQALEQTGLNLVDASASQVLPGTEVDNSLSVAAAKHLGIQVSDLQIPVSMLPRLATVGSEKLKVSPSGDLYRASISVEAMVRAVWPTTATRIPRDVLQDRMQRRFPDATHQSLPLHAKLAAFVESIDPALEYDSAKRAYFLPEETKEEPSLHTRVTRTPTLSRADRPRGALPEKKRRLLSTLEETLQTKSFRVLQVQTGEATKTAELLETHLSAQTINVSDIVLNEVKRKLQDAGHGDFFPQMLASDSLKHPDRPKLQQVIRSSAETALTNALATHAPATVLTDASILADFGCLDLLKPWADIASGANRCAVWLINPEDNPGYAPATDILGNPIPLSSPDQVLSV